MVCRWLEACPLRRLERENKISNKWKKKYCESGDNWKNCKRYQADERGEPHPDNMMPDGTLKNSMD